MYWQTKCRYPVNYAKLNDLLGHAPRRDLLQVDFFHRREQAPLDQVRERSAKERKKERRMVRIQIIHIAHVDITALTTRSTRISRNPSLKSTLSIWRISISSHQRQKKSGANGSTNMRSGWTSLTLEHWSVSTAERITPSKIRCLVMNATTCICIS